MSARLVTYPDREAWLAARRGGIGASEAAALLGLSRWTSPLQLWAEKRGLTPPSAETPEMRRGRRLEPLVAEDVAAATGLTVLDHGRHTIAWSTETPCLYASLDREMRHPQLGPGVLECKTTKAYLGKHWPDAALSGFDTTVGLGQVPVDAFCQVQHQMLVTGAGWGILAAWIGLDDFRYFMVAPHADMQARIAAAGVAFWAAVEAGAEPPAATADDLALVVQLHATTDKQLVMTLPPEAGAWDAAYADACETYRKADKDREALKAQILQAMGEAGKAIAPGGATYTVSRIPVAEKVVKAHTQVRLNRRAPEGA